MRSDYSLADTQDNKLEVQSRTARQFFYIALYPALLNLRINDQPKEMHTNVFV